MTVVHTNSLKLLVYLDFHVNLPLKRMFIRALPIYEMKLGRQHELRYGETRNYNTNTSKKTVSVCIKIGTRSIRNFIAAMLEYMHIAHLWFGNKYETYFPPKYETRMRNV